MGKKGTPTWKLAEGSSCMFTPTPVPTTATTSKESQEIAKPKEKKNPHATTADKAWIEAQKQEKLEKQNEKKDTWEEKWAKIKVLVLCV